MTDQSASADIAAFLALSERLRSLVAFEAQISASADPPNLPRGSVDGVAASDVLADVRRSIVVLRRQTAPLLVRVRPVVLARLRSAIWTMHWRWPGFEGCRWIQQLHDDQPVLELTSILLDGEPCALASAPKPLSSQMAGALSRCPAEVLWQSVPAQDAAELEATVHGVTVLRYL